MRKIALKGTTILSSVVREEAKLVIEERVASGKGRIVRIVFNQSQIHLSKDYSLRTIIVNIFS